MPSTSPATSAAMGPTVSYPGDRGHTPSSGTRPQVVLSPVVPQHAAGMRTDPPVSLPKATSASSVATATAAPLDEPPGTSRGSSGFTGVPYQGFTPVTPKASSCRLVRPTMRAPAARAPARQAASAPAGTASLATARHPAVVGTPSMSMRSLTANRTPGPDVSKRVMNVDIAVPPGACGATTVACRYRSQRRPGPVPGEAAPPAQGL